ncbi:MAG: hypothetical protein QGI15_04035, partial [Candidatus Scalindua sp.]|nr:hypothetical protein [Candidatus Scalindua sp.]
EVGSICGKYFLKLDHLHYGYWTGDMEVDVANLHLAQDEYAKFVISHIPDGVKTILDVGCGTGQIAKELLDMGVSRQQKWHKLTPLVKGDLQVFSCMQENT